MRKGKRTLKQVLKYVKKSLLPVYIILFRFVPASYLLHPVGKLSASLS